MGVYLTQIKGMKRALIGKLHNKFLTCAQQTSYNLPTVEEQDQFECAQYILTPNSFFYFDGILQPIETTVEQRDTLCHLLSNNQSPDHLSETMLQDIALITGHLHSQMTFSQRLVDEFNRETDDVAAPITQIRTFLKALDHLEQFVVMMEPDIEALMTNKAISFQSLTVMSQLVYKGLLSRQGINHLYDACYLLTHVDIDVMQMFKDDWRELMCFVNDIKPYVSMSLERSVFPRSHQAGMITGLVVKELDNTPQAFLMRFPSYLNASYKTFFSDIAVAPIDRNNAMIAWLEQQTWDGIHVSDSQLYKDFIRPIFELQTDLTTNSRNLHTASKQRVHQTVTSLYAHMACCMAFIDKKEQDFLLASGQLADPMIRFFEAIHEDILLSLEDFMDVEAEGLSVFQNDVFMHHRLAPAYRRWVDDAYECEHLDTISLKIAAFFRLLTVYRDKRLIELPKGLKSALRKHYQLIQPYLAEVDITLSNVIVRGLINTPDNTLTENTLNSAFHFFGSRLTTAIDYSDRVSRILSVHPALHSSIQKKIATRRFSQVLNRDSMVLILTTTHTAEDAQRLIDEAIGRAQEATMRVPIEVSGALVCDRDAEARATRVVKRPVYSEAVGRLGQQFHQVLMRLSPQIQQHFEHVRIDQSLPFPSLVPYCVAPDFNASLVMLQEPVQLFSLKQLVNGLYFIHQSAVLLESLDEKSFKEDYLKTFIEMGMQLNLAYQVLTQLRHNERYFSEVTSDLLTSLQRLVDNVMFIRRDYFPADGWEMAVKVIDDSFDPRTYYNNKPTLLKIGQHYYIYGHRATGTWGLTQLDTALMSSLALDFSSDAIIPYDLRLDDLYRHIDLKEAHVEPRHDSLFIVTNILTLLPTHIELGSAFLPMADVEKTHAIAMTVSNQVAQVIRQYDEGGYLAVFWSLPEMVSLVRQCKERLSRALVTSYEGVMDNLAGIHSELLTPIQVQADCWEERLCLTPGSVSDPIKRILDVYYQGVLESLDLGSSNYLQLMTSMDSFDKRIVALQTRMMVLEDDLPLIDKDIDELDRFCYEVTIVYADDAWNQNTIRWFNNKIRPILNKHLLLYQKSYLKFFEQNEYFLRKICDDELSAPVNWVPIRAIIDICLAACQGKEASLLLTQTIQLEKMTYFKQQRATQGARHQALKESLIANLFDRELATHFGEDQVYNQALSAYINRLMPKMVWDMSLGTCSDLERDVVLLLENKINEFDSQCAQEYRQLYALKEAITRMKVYVQTQSEALDLVGEGRASKEFETQITLEAKRRLITELEATVLHDQPIKHTLAQAHALITHEEFEPTMRQYHHFDAFTYDWLVQCVTLFLEWASLYESERNQCYGALKALVPRTPGFFQICDAPESDDDAGMFQGLGLS
jgi:hypothetical protein